MPVSYIRHVLGWNPRLVLARPSCSPLVAWVVWTGRRGVHLSSGFSLPLQDKEDGEPNTKQLREGEEEGEKHR